MYVMGLDLGTQGARAVVTDAKGVVLAQVGTAYARINTAQREGWKEQDPHLWRDSALQVIRAALAVMRDRGLQPEGIAALAVDGTSGTVLPVDGGGCPLSDALCYNDQRAGEQARETQRAGEELSLRLGYRFDASFALPKILWIRSNLPELYGRTCRFIHHSDYVTGMLTGVFDTTDYSNALKTGYDLIDLRWPDFISHDLGIDSARLPRVLAPGASIAPVSRAAAVATGLSVRTMVVAGATDGYCSAIASGIRAPGDFCTTIGTTMVIKGVTNQLIHDPQGRVYCHLHPEGLWFPGGASNTGGICLNNRFDRSLFPEYDKVAEDIAPSGTIIYPLVGLGERFPFKKPDAKEFIIGGSPDGVTLYTALMEGVGYTERLSYDMLAGLGCPIGDTLYASGGAVKSPQWNRIRANIMGKRLLIPRTAEAAMGSAILAASRTIYRSLGEATMEMVHFEGEAVPKPEKARRYEELYRDFVRECVRRGYIGEEAAR